MKNGITPDRDQTLAIPHEEGPACSSSCLSQPAWNATCIPDFLVIVYEEQEPCPTKIK